MDRARAITNIYPLLPKTFFSRVEWGPRYLSCLEPRSDQLSPSLLPLTSQRQCMLERSKRHDNWYVFWASSRLMSEGYVEQQCSKCNHHFENSRVLLWRVTSLLRYIWKINKSDNITALPVRPLTVEKPLRENAPFGLFKLVFNRENRVCWTIKFCYYLYNNNYKKSKNPEKEFFFVFFLDLFRGDFS